MPKILETYEIWTPEDKEIGATDDQGWIDEEGYEIEPDDLDFRDYRREWEISEDTPDEEIYEEVVAQAAADYLEDHYVDTAGFPFSPGLSYTNYDHDTNWETGGEEQRSYHLEGFTPEQEKFIFEALTL
jgi:hypothetical protein